MCFLLSSHRPSSTFLYTSAWSFIPFSVAVSGFTQRETAKFPILSITTSPRLPLTNSQMRDWLDYLCSGPAGRISYQMGVIGRDRWEGLYAVAVTPCQNLPCRWRIVVDCSLEWGIGWEDTMKVVYSIERIQVRKPLPLAGLLPANSSAGGLCHYTQEGHCLPCLSSASPPSLLFLLASSV